MTAGSVDQLRIIIGDAVFSLQGNIREAGSFVAA
jgi:hypothetical protein